MVFCLDRYKRPMDMITEKRARKLLTKGRAVVHKAYPFTIRIKDVDSRIFETRKKEYQVKIDPGATHTGIAIVERATNTVCNFSVIKHRGTQVKNNVKTRSGARRNRRNRETRYRHCKWPNKKGQKSSGASKRRIGWLPPSVKSAPDNIITILRRTLKALNVTKISLEFVKFDTQLMENPDISGVEYQYGTLFEQEVKSYLLEKYGHRCQYCGGESGDPKLEVEHIIAKCNGGSDKVSNLTIVCHTCNAEKGGRNLDKWLDDLKAKKNQTPLDKKRIKLIENFMDGTPNVSERYAAWMNEVRYYLLNSIRKYAPSMELELSTGARTAHNRKQFWLPKEHYFDALCVGEVPELFSSTHIPILYIDAKGRGSRLRGNINKCGVITVKYKDNTKQMHGFQSGDIVKADIPKGKYAGQYIGRISVRKSGTFAIRTTTQQTFDVNHKHCKLLQKADGYTYRIGTNTFKVRKVRRNSLHD